MVRKYIVDSVKYWADEYHIDGFRFDLVGLIDIQTINELVAEVHKTHPSVVFYGEGWDMATGVTKPDVIMATKANAHLTPGFGYFSDDIRDMLKGSVFINDDTGYISGKAHLEPLAQACFTADLPWCAAPAQTINYASCHDNISLWDRLAMSCPKASFADRVRMNNLAAAFYLTAQGVPFLQAGEEMLRSKPNPDGSFEHNSYRSPDSVNSLKWNDLSKKEYQDVVAYYQGLIAFRKAFPSLRMSTKEQIHQNIEVLSGLEANVTAFHIHGEDHGIIAVFNPNPHNVCLALPEGTWHTYVNDTMAGDLPLSCCSGTAAVAPISALMLVQDHHLEESTGSKTIPLMLGGIAAAAAALGAAVAVASKKRKK
jgi:pullulanase